MAAFNKYKKRSLLKVHEDHVCDFAFLLHKGTSNLFVHDLPIRHLVPGDFFGHSIFMKRYDNKTGDNVPIN